MPTTTKGIPYPSSSDNVDIPGDMQALAEGVESYFMPAVATINAQSGTTYTLVLADLGKVVAFSNASGATVTVPTNASVAYATGAQVRVLNVSTGVVTVAGAGGVTVNGSALTLGPNEEGTLLKTATNTWSLVLGGGSGGARGGGTDDVFYENSQTVTANYTITSSKNAISAGPVTINSGVTVTIPSGSYWSVV